MSKCTSSSSSFLGNNIKFQTSYKLCCLIHSNKLLDAAFSPFEHALFEKLSFFWTEKGVALRVGLGAAAALHRWLPRISIRHNDKLFRSPFYFSPFTISRCKSQNCQYRLWTTTKTDSILGFYIFQRICFGGHQRPSCQISPLTRSPSVLRAMLVRKKGESQIVVLTGAAWPAVGSLRHNWMVDRPTVESDC
jgi:hypothetical protein